MKKLILPVALLAGFCLTAFVSVTDKSIESSMSVTFIVKDSMNTNLNYSIVPRNTNAPFSVFVDKIRQDDKLIGLVVEGKKKNYGSKAVVYDIKLPKGLKIAEIAALEKDAKVCTVLTLRDQKTHELTIYNGPKEMDYVAVRYLIEKGYL